MLITLLIVFLVLSIAGGALGYGRFGAAGLSPAGLLIVVLLVLLLTGRL